MFGRQSGLGSTSGGSGSNLVEFRAGRMNMVGKMVHPDTRKGLVYLTQSEDNLMHFCWKDRTSGKVEDDLIVFPDDFEYKRIEQCKTGRVYLLKCKTSQRKLFFWMQEPKTDKDEEFCRRVNELMNNPPTANRSGSDGGDLQYMLNNMSQQQLMQLFGGVGQMGGLSSLLGSMNRSSDSSLSRSNRTGTPTSNRSATAGSGGATNPFTPENTTSAIPRTPNAPRAAAKGKISGNAKGVTLPDLQSYLSALSPDGSGGTRPININNVDLATAINSTEAVNQIIADSERVEALSSHLPDTAAVDSASGGDKKQQIKETITSPQFQQALSLFSNALQSGQLGPVVSQFELAPEAVAAANTGDMEQFVKALEKTNITDDKAAEDKDDPMGGSEDKKE